MLKNKYFWIASFWTFVVAILCLANFGNMPKVALVNSDKYVHFVFHFVFTGLWFLCFYHEKNGLSNAKKIFLVFLLSFAYGILVEIMQDLFTRTRKADVFDVFANTAGALTAVILIRFYQMFLQKEKIRN